MSKDALMEKVGIPTAEIKCDIGDPNFISYDEMKKSLEDFFDLLEDRKRR